MSDLTKLQNKLKQFNLHLDTSKIYSQAVAGKRSCIFSREDKTFYDKNDFIWKSALRRLHGKRASYYIVESVKYKSDIDIDVHNRYERDEEREWYATEIGYTEIKLISKATRKETIIRIG